MQMGSIGEDRSSRMLIGCDRLFYAGLVGNSMKTRRLGAVTIYASGEADLDIRIGAGGWESRCVVALAPYTPHMIRARSGQIANLCLESESIDPNEIDTVIQDINSRKDERMVEHIAEARREIGKIGNANASPLAPRALSCALTVWRPGEDEDATGPPRTPAHSRSCLFSLQERGRPRPPDPLVRNLET